MEKLADAKKIAASGMYGFIKILLLIPTLPHLYVRDAVTKVPDMMQAKCQSDAATRISPIC
jgi:hypothetical protein